MEFIAVKDFTFTSPKVRKRLSKDGKMVVTKKGKPAALVLDLKNADLEQTLNDLQKLEWMRLLERFWERNAGKEPLSDEEIEAEIRVARTERKAKQAANI